MSPLTDERAKARRDVPQNELLERLETDFEKMMGVLEALGPEDWTGLMVPHSYMRPVPAFFYAAGSSWTTACTRGTCARAPAGRMGSPVTQLTCSCLSMFWVWQGTVRPDVDRAPCEIGIRIGGRNAGDYVVRVTGDGLTYELGNIESLPACIEFYASSFVLIAFGRINGNTVRGDLKTAERFLNAFFRI